MHLKLERSIVGACALTVAMPMLLFRQPVTGSATWIGNPDRLNVYLKLALFWIRGIANGRIDAWNEHEMLGFDSFAMPYAFPTPVLWLGGVFDAADFIAVQGWLSICLLILAGIMVLWFLRTIGSDWFGASVGAACYQLCGLTILKVSQYDVGFAIFVLMPLAMTMICQSLNGRATLIFSGLAVALTSMLLFFTLQSVAYMFMIVGTYALWRGFQTRRLNVVIQTGAASVVAVLIASPRLLGDAMAIAQYSRVVQGIDLHNFDSTYYFQNIRPYEILRWFDGTLFGIAHSDATRLQNNINLSEGFLLTTSAAVPFALSIGILKFHSRWGGLLLERARDTAFWSWSLLFTILVVVWKPLNHLFYVLFFSLDFTHARILCVGLLAMCALVSIVLSEWNPRASKAAWIVGLIAGVAAAVLLEVAAGLFTGAASLASLGLISESHSAINVRVDAAMRIGGSVAMAGALTCLILFQKMRNRQVAGTAHAALGVFIVAQAFGAADVQVNGAQTVSRSQPFYRGDMYMAARHEFGVPTALQIDALRARVGDVRVALICDPEVAGGFCAGHIAGMWQLRSVDGYYGLGVPDRLRKLPWGDAIGLHTISFTGAENLPWPVLSLLNAGKILVVSNELFKNYSIDGSPADVNRIQIIDNLQPVVPRAFLAKSGEPVADSVEASRRIFGGSRAVDVRERSYVEGLTAATTYAAEGEVNVVGSGDQLQFDVSSSTGPRLLIVNELFFPGWRAFVDGSEVPILPANVAMRAVVLSPSAKNVTMTYEPFVRTSRAVYLHLFGIFVFFLCLFGFARAKTGALD